jgi:enamine deaminase RidA (YjgF/YER057c/UK114 family)
VWSFRGKEGLIDEWMHGHSRALIQDPFVFVTNTTGFDYMRMTMAEDVVDQARSAWNIIWSVLAQVDSDFSEIVQCRYYVKDQADCEPVLRCSRDILNGVRPALTMVILPSLPHPQARVAMEVTAMWGGRTVDFSHPSALA